MNLNAIRSVVAVTAMAASTVALANDFVAVRTYIDSVRDQKNIFQVLNECTNNSICSAAMSAASNYFQVTTVRLNEPRRADSQALARTSGRFGLVPT